MVSAAQGPRFCIDTSSLVQAWTRAYPIDLFPTFWDKMDDLVDKGRIIAPDEVLRETGRRDDGLYKWLKERDGLIWKIDDELQASVSQVMADFPFMVKNRTGKNAADPWVVALARITSATVVTEENEDNSTTNPKIPLVCKHYKVRFIRLLELIRREGWQF